MGRKRVDDKIVSYTVQIRTSQRSWIEQNKDVKINKFFRDQLDKFIQLKNSVKAL